MTSTATGATHWRNSPWRYLMWLAAAALIAVAGMATEALRQGEYALVVTAALFALGCTVVELGARKSARWTYAAGAAIAALTGLGQVWMNLAVGLVGSEDNPVNLVFFAVVAVAMLGALLVRGKAAGMVWVMGLAAAIQVLAGAIGMTAGDAVHAPPSGMLFLTTFFAGLWLNAAALFRAAARAG